MAYGPNGSPLFTAGAASSFPVTWQGGQGLFAVSGTVATAKMQFLGPDGATYLDVPTTALAAAGGILFFLHRATVRAVVTGSDATTYASAYPIPVGV